MIAWGNTTDRILLLLTDEPMTKAELCRRLELTHDQVASILSRLNRKSKRLPKRIFISGHTRHTRLGRSYIRPIYSLGSSPDKNPPPPLTQKERSAESYQRLKALRNASIFTQSLSTRQIKKMRSNNETRNTHPSSPSGA